MTESKVLGMKLFLNDTEAFDDEQDLLDKIPLPGNPVSEQQMKQKWLSLPRRGRIAVRRLHRKFRQLPKNAFVQLLRVARVPKELIEAAEVHNTMYVLPLSHPYH